jgi:hypothetical protein
VVNWIFSIGFLPAPEVCHFCDFLATPPGCKFFLVSFSPILPSFVGFSPAWGMFTHGIFRFFHEFLRATPPIIGPFSGYQFAALSVAALGAAGFVLRRQPRSTNPATPP